MMSNFAQRKEELYKHPFKIKSGAINCIYHASSIRSPHYNYIHSQIHRYYLMVSFCKLVGVIAKPHSILSNFQYDRKTK